MFQEDFRLIANLNEKIFISYYKNFINDDDSKLFDFFEKHIIYNTDEQSKIKIFGKEMSIPRKQVAYGDLNTNYSFSGTKVVTRDWNSTTEDKELCDLLLLMRNKVASRFNFQPNFVLINRYEDGDQYVGYHSDDEKDLVKGAPIVGISFGAEREISFMSISNNENKKRMLLKNGSVFCMHYPTNKFYMHSIPKQKGINRPRISFTFRQMTRLTIK
jgi:alpha-ketoglutarate-dependent dioxygenase alkB family protein 2